MLSRDASGLDAHSSTANRWRLLRDAGADLDIIVAASSGATWNENGIRVTGTGGGILGKFWRAFFLAMKKNRQAELVTAQDPFELGKIGWIAARLADKPFEIQDHGGFFDGRKPDEPLWFLRGWLARFLSRRADAIRTVSPLSFEALAKEGMKEKTYHLPIAPRESFVEIDRKPESDLLVTVARLVPVKRTALLIDAFHALHEKRPSARLVIVGDGPERGTIEQRLRDLHLSDAVTLAGEGDPAPWLAKAAGFVSLSAHEGWGVASVEAAMVGVPVLMTRTGCGPTLEATGNATLLEPDETRPAVIAEAMEKLLDGPAPRKWAQRSSAPEAAQLQAEAWKKIKATPFDRVILAIVALVFFASVGYAFAYHIRPAVDAQTYDQVGWNLAQGKGFRLDLSVPIEKDEVITYQGPFYQFFLAGIYVVFGHRVEAVWMIQAILRALSALLLYLMCRRMFSPDGKRIGWFAAALFGFHPDLIEIGAMLMTETTFLFFTILTLYCFTRQFKRATNGGVLALSLSFGAAILARSSIIVFAALFAWRFFRQKAYAKIILFGVLMAMILTPWTLRNYLTYGKVLPTMANFGYNLWVGNRVGVDGEGGNPPELFRAMRDYGMIGANYYATEQYNTFIHEHPVLYAGLTTSRTLKYFSFLRPMGFWFYQQGIGQAVFIASSIAWGFALFVSFFGGLSVAWRRERKNAMPWYFVGFLFLTVISVVPILFETRYRFPAYPIFAIFGGLFLGRWTADRKAYANDLWIGLGVAGTIAFATLALEYQKILARIRLFLD